MLKANKLVLFRDQVVSSHKPIMKLHSVKQKLAALNTDVKDWKVKRFAKSVFCWAVISCWQTQLVAIVMEDVIHFLQAAGVWDLFSKLFHDQELLR